MGKSLDEDMKRVDIESDESNNAGAEQRQAGSTTAMLLPDDEIRMNRNGGSVDSDEAPVNNSQRHPLKGFLWWGLNHEGFDFITLMGIFVCIPLEVVAITIPARTRNDLILKISAVTVIFIAFVGLITYRSRRKYQRYYKKNSCGQKVLNCCDMSLATEESNRIRAQKETTTTTTQRQHSIRHFVKHTFLEITILVGAVATLTALKEITGDTKTVIRNNETVTPAQFVLLYIQIFAAVAIFFRYFYKIQTISEKVLRLEHLLDCQEVGILTIHMTATIIGWSAFVDLWNLAYYNNPWSTPLYIFGACVVSGVVIARCASAPRRNNNDAHSPP